MSDFGIDGESVSGKSDKDVVERKWRAGNMKDVVVYL